MKLTLEITDEQLEELKNALKIDFIDYQKHWGRQVEQARVLQLEDYAGRILRARRALELSTNAMATCFNPPDRDPDIMEWENSIIRYPPPDLDKPQ